VSREELNQVDSWAARVLDSIPEADEQAQYSLTDQLAVLREFARKLKLYDAMEFLEGRA
jgi:hypothetical protein